MQIIILVGYMGVGKTTLGKILSNTTGLQFIDLDKYIEDRFNMSINEMFNLYGEQKFRDIERNILHEICENNNGIILSCGGGTPCFFDNMDYMNNIGTTFFLDANEEIIYNNLKNDKSNRPLLKDKSDDDLKYFIKNSLSERIVYYKKSKYIIHIKELNLKKNKEYINNIMRHCGIINNK